MPLTLATTFLLTGCSPAVTTRTAATEAAIAADVCRAWIPVTYSSRDTDQTQLKCELEMPRKKPTARATRCDDQTFLQGLGH